MLCCQAGLLALNSWATGMTTTPSSTAQALSVSSLQLHLLAPAGRRWSGPILYALFSQTLCQQILSASAPKGVQNSDTCPNPCCCHLRPGHQDTCAAPHLSPTFCSDPATGTSHATLLSVQTLGLLPPLTPRRLPMASAAPRVPCSPSALSAYPSLPLPTPRPPPYRVSLSGAQRHPPEPSQVVFPRPGSFAPRHLHGSLLKCCPRETSS